MVSLMQRKWCREADQTFPQQFAVSRHLNATETCITILLGTALLFLDTYTSTANILAVTDKYMSVRFMAVQLPNMGCNFLGCILLAHRKLGESRA